MTYCKNCGQELQSDWKLCPKCAMKVEVNQKLDIAYKKRRKNPSQFTGICLFTFGIIFAILSMGLLYFYNYWSEDGANGGVVLSSMMLAFGLFILIGGIYLIRKKSKYFK
jgi:uncharacterized membrane protein YvbJ